MPVRSIFVFGGALLVAVTTTLPVASFADGMFVGVEKCTDCHQEAAHQWASGPHAKATRTLGKRRRDRTCVSCHTTGSAAGKRLDGVQCEACHGAGRGYAPEDVMRNPKLSRDLGLRDLSTPRARNVLCRSCHLVRTKLTPFDTESAWRSIAHQ